MVRHPSARRCPPKPFHLTAERARLPGPTEEAHDRGAVILSAGVVAGTSGATGAASPIGFSLPRALRCTKRPGAPPALLVVHIIGAPSPSGPCWTVFVPPLPVRYQDQPSTMATPPSGLRKAKPVTTPLGTLAFSDAPPPMTILVAFFHVTAGHGVGSGAA